MITILEEFNTAIPEGSDITFTTTLTDEDSAAVPLADVDTLTMTLWKKGGAVINSQENANIKSSLHATTGLLSIALVPADNVMVDTSADSETHQIVVWCLLDNGLKFPKYFEFTVQNIER